MPLNKISIYTWNHEERVLWQDNEKSTIKRKKDIKRENI